MVTILSAAEAAEKPDPSRIAAGDVNWHSPSAEYFGSVLQNEAYF